MANVLYGLNNTHKITLSNIIQHTKSVKTRCQKISVSSRYAKKYFTMILLKQKKCKVDHKKNWLPCSKNREQ